MGVIDDFPCTILMQFHFWTQLHKYLLECIINAPWEPELSGSHAENQGSTEINLVPLI